MQVKLKVGLMKSAVMRSLEVDIYCNFSGDGVGISMMGIQ